MAKEKENKLTLPVDQPRRPTTRYIKADRPETKLRLQKVISWLRKGYSRRKCIDRIMEEWEFSEAQARRYVHDAFTMIYEASKVASNEELREQYVDRIEELLNEAIENKKVDMAVRLLDMLNKVNGMYTEKQEINANVTTDTIKFKFDE